MLVEERRFYGLVRVRKCDFVIAVDLSEEAIEATIRSVTGTKPVEPMDLATVSSLLSAQF